ncbi:MAG: hypothetical protein M3N33_09655, partial [Actinomycetota bacterium]|nr:hypothetical protein [Actinomycetota bacterium]
ATLEGRLAGLADGEERIGWLEELPALVEEYLRDLPHLGGRKTAVREHETVPPEKTEENPLGLYTLTAERVRRLGAGDLEEKRRAAEEERSERFRQLYAMLDLRVVCHKDRSLEVTWGGDCSSWLGRA